MPLNHPHTVVISEDDQKRLPKEIKRDTLFVCNRWVRGFEEALLSELLYERYPNIKLISGGNASKKQTSLPDFIFEKEWSHALKFLKKKDNEHSPRVMAMSIPFNANRMEAWVQQESLKALLKFLRDSDFDIIPIYLERNSTLLTAAADFKNWKKVFMHTIRSGIQQPSAIKITARVGTCITPKELQKLQKTQHIWRFFQSRMYALSLQQQGNWFDMFKSFLPLRHADENQEIAPPGDHSRILQEIEALRQSSRVLEQGDYEVMAAKADQIPHLIYEIGRQREITFRTVGEGTGQPYDLDSFDLYYLQLIIWDKKNHQLVGGYRIGCGDEILSQFGAMGFYCSTLFKIKPGFYPVLSQSLELGRSYIVPAYQKKPQPLFLLWKGVVQFLTVNPQYKFICGPVSISRQFSDLSRAVIVSFLKKHFFDQKYAEYLTPRKPFRVKIKKVDTELIANTLDGNIETLDRFIESLESESMRLPVLLKQYIRQNAKFVSFNIDPQFSDCLDGFMLLDLTKVQEDTLVNQLQQSKAPN